MSELPEVREYREAQLRRNQNWNEDAYVKMRLADAAISALEAELEHYDEDITKQVFICAELRKRAEAAEAENERLRVCGNCKRLAFGACMEHERYDVDSDEMVPHSEPTNYADQCHFTPSRWQAREEAK